MGGSGKQQASNTIGAAMFEDINCWREQRLHWLVAGVLVPVLAVTVLGITVFSAAFAAVVTLEGFIEHLTINASWFFVSLFALIGLFVAYPAHETQQEFRTLCQSRTVLLGTLFSRWVLVGGSALLAFVVPLVVGAVAFDSFPLVPAIVFATVTALSLMAYTSLGVTLAAVVRSDNRLLLSLLATYWVLAHLWETSLIPLVAGIAVSGDPEVAIGTPPVIHDVLLAMSPSGAHATISQLLVTGQWGTVESVAILALLGWLVLPLGVALYRT